MPRQYSPVVLQATSDTLPPLAKSGPAAEDAGSSLSEARHPSHRVLDAFPAAGSQNAKSLAAVTPSLVSTRDQKSSPDECISTSAPALFIPPPPLAPPYDAMRAEAVKRLLTLYNDAFLPGGGTSWKFTGQST